MDRVKNAIIDLGHQIGWIEGNEHHQFPGWQNVTNAMREAASLLKEQQKLIDDITQRRANNGAFD